jgi:hypothetical protein
MSPENAAAELRRAASFFTAAVGFSPDCASAPAWVLAPGILREEERLRMRYAADTRGTAPYRPRLAGRVSLVPQVPTTLPTLDELIGLDGVTESNFAERIVAKAVAAGTDAVFTLHAEAEGMSWHACFVELLKRLKDAGIPCVPCGALLEGVQPSRLPVCEVVLREVPGRAGLLSSQGDRVDG